MASPDRLRRVKRQPRLRPTPIYDALVTDTNGEPLGTFHGQPGGEWDCLRYVPFRQRQRLTTAGFLARKGMAPDVFADWVVGICGTKHGDSIDEVIAWYLRDSELSIQELQAARHHARHQRIAEEMGLSTEFEWRDERARLRGYPSYYAMRMAKGWGDGH